MSSALTSDYSMVIKNNSSVSFSLFHAAEYFAGATSRPAQDLSPGATTVYAWDSTIGQTAPTKTCHGHIYYSPVKESGPARAWAVEIQGYTPDGGRPKTRYQYGDASLEYPKSEPSPQFWLAAPGKSWRDSYSFAMPYSKVMITVADDPHEAQFESTGRPLYSIAVTIEDFDE
ncbi:hypothetical protein R3P38DRAFT_2511512 [Favolaschia claudopus]|uniref:Uncharacterized protein n=1 Tax=Favolaschia claudopus TaxID=2862362 RepID=A0AAW0CVA9_9AGAR